MTSKALLVQDVQRGVLNLIFNDQQAEAYLSLLQQTITAARKANLKIIYITIGFRPGYPESHPNNTATKRVSSMGAFVTGHPSVEVYPSVAPEEGDVVITKHRNSSFTGTELELLLRSLGIGELVLTGTMTSGVILSTVRQAADLDYLVTVLKDGCADRDPEVHEFLMDRIFPGQVKVMASEEWVKSMQ